MQTTTAFEEQQTRIGDNKGSIHYSHKCYGYFTITIIIIIIIIKQNLLYFFPHSLTMSLLPSVMFCGFIFVVFVLPTNSILFFFSFCRCCYLLSAITNLVATETSYNDDGDDG